MAIEDRPVPAGAVSGDRTGPRGRGNPALLLIAGAGCTSASAMFVKLAGASAGTAAFFRCALALVALVPLAVAERRRAGPRPLRWQLVDVTAGVLLGVDFVFWAASVLDVGASIATVLINIQVVVFPLLARVVSGIRLSGRFLLTVPVMLAGVALASGAVGHAEPGSHPVTGVVFGTAAGVAYAGYLFLMRLGGGHDHTISPVCTATASAAATAAVLGGMWTGIQWSPGWPALGWLAALALLGQVLALLLFNTALPRLAPSVGATLLLMQPVMAFVFGVGVLDERPTLTQVGGCVLVITAVWYTNRTPRPQNPARQNPET